MTFQRRGWGRGLSAVKVMSSTMGLLIGAVELLTMMLSI
jgi:hypothetical protein